MFTGIIAALGTVTDITPDAAPGITRISIDSQGLTDDLEAGGSMAVNGICLTALADGRGGFTAEMMGETLARTSLGSLKVGDRVNLERCVRPDGWLDGHIVQGHVDGTGTITAVTPQGDWTLMRISVPQRLASQIAEKGSIAVDGISLTVTAVNPASSDDAWFEVGLIPITLEKTRLGSLHEGDVVNIETDVIAKYVERLIAVREGEQA